MIRAWSMEKAFFSNFAWSLKQVCRLLQVSCTVIFRYRTAQSFTLRIAQ